MKLITKDIERQLKANNMKDTLGRPVVKLFGGGALHGLYQRWKMTETPCLDSVTSAKAHRRWDL